MKPELQSELSMVQKVALKHKKSAKADYSSLRTSAGNALLQREKSIFWISLCLPTG